MPCKLCPCVFTIPVIAAVGLVASFGWTRLNQPATQPEKKAPAQPTSPKPKPDADKKDAKPADTRKADDAYVLGFKMNRIDGTSEDLSIYKGKVIIMVNVASKCGYTPQYDSLEALYKEYKDKGLVILGFPANNFNSQEPGSNSEIAQFCSSKHNVTFPLFEKISVKGDDQHALYKKLAAQPAPIGGDPKWNFTKFVVNKDGNVVARFDAKGDGGDRAKLEPALVKKVKELLGVADEPKKEDKPAPKAGS